MKKEPDKEKQKRREASIRGLILKTMIAEMTATEKGHALQNGEARKHVDEPPYRCPKGYVRELIAADNFDMEFYSPLKNSRQKVVLQLHGGGYIGPMKNSYRRFSIEYSKAGSGCHVLTIDYRVAPEYTYPAALEDAVFAYKWLLSEKKFEPEDIVIAGDSAGGGLALCLGHYLKDHDIPLPAGYILMSPWTDLTLSGDSYEYNYEKDPLFGKTKESMLYICPYVTSEEEKRHPYVSPLFGDFSGFSPMLYQVGDQEMMLSDSLLAAKKAKKAGVEVEITVYKEMFHIFQNGLSMFPESKQAWEEVHKFLTKLWK